jgi:hypothetical protein
VLAIEAKITQGTPQGGEPFANTALHRSLGLTKCRRYFCVRMTTEVCEVDGLSFTLGEFTNGLLHPIGHGEIPNFAVEIGFVVGSIVQEAFFATASRSVSPNVVNRFTVSFEKKPRS